MASYVLDSYAMLALLQDEPGAERVSVLLHSGVDENWIFMSEMNLGEVAYIIERRWGVEKLRTILAYLDTTSLRFVELTRTRILHAAHLKANHAIAYADAFAAGLAQELDAVLVTADPEFEALANVVNLEWLPTD